MVGTAADGSAAPDQSVGDVHPALAVGQQTCL